MHRRNIFVSMDLLRRINPHILLWYGFAGMFFSLPVGTSPLAMCGIFVLVMWVASGTFPDDIRTWARSDIKIPILILILLPWIGMIYTPVPREGLSVALKTHYWLFSIALMPVLQSRIRAADQGAGGDPDLIIKAFLAGLVLNSAVATVQFLGFIPMKRGIPVGLMGGDSAHIPFSLLLTTGIVVSSFYYFRARSGKERFIYALLMIQFFVTIHFVGARSGYLALIVLSPLIAYNVLGRKHLFGIATGSMVLVILLFSFPVVQSRVSKVKDDLMRYKQGDVNTSVGLRLHMWEIALREIGKSPLIGTGTAGFLEAWEHNKKDPSLPFFIHGNPHNSFLYMTVSFGIPGLVAFCWLLFIMARNGWSERGSPPGFALFAFTVVFITGSIVDTPLLSVAAAQALSLFAGIAGAVRAS